MPSSAYRGRLAPSPTGALHVGTARTALLAWLAARAAGGTLVLRIEDLDGPRVVPFAAEGIMEDLRWLGIDWDEGPDVSGAFGPYLQSERSAHYDRALGQLERAGGLFRCSCTRSELQASSAPHGEMGPRYAGTCRNGPLHPGRPCSLRFRMDGAEGFVDRLHGAQPPAQDDDFIVRRSDGLYAYQLAVVVDDIAMAITEVVRGADLLQSTSWQLALYRALGATPPAFLHVPLVVGADGKRLAKRHGSTAVAEYRKQGTAPERLIGMLAASLGLVREADPVHPADLVERYDLARLSIQTAVFSEGTVSSGTRVSK